MAVKIWIEILPSARFGGPQIPDAMGRVHFVKRWRDETPAYCLTCGKSPEQKCQCYGKLKFRGQHYFAVPPKDGETKDGAVFVRGLPPEQEDGYGA